MSGFGGGFIAFFPPISETIKEAQYSGGYLDRGFVDYGTIGERIRKPPSPEEEKVEDIIERIAEKVVKTKAESKEADIELILRLRLEVECIEFKVIYLTWLLDEIKRERYNKAVVLLLLN